MPRAAAYLWGWFLELNAARAGTVPISYRELEAWSRLSGLSLSPWEVKALKALDTNWLDQLAFG